jgi:hypothetical protein
MVNDKWLIKNGLHNRNPFLNHIKIITCPANAGVQTIKGKQASTLRLKIGVSSEKNRMTAKTSSFLFYYEHHKLHEHFFLLFV